MKRILTLILVLALALTTFVGCEFIGQLFPGFGECKEHVDENGDYICDKCEAEIHQHNYVDGECECGEKDPHVHNYVDGVCECGATDAEYEDLLSASAYIRQLYKDDATYTPDDLTLVGKVEVGSSKFTVVWTVSSDKITVVASPDGSTVVIDVPEVTEDSTEEIPYTLTATITSENGYTATRTFDRVVPKFQVNTFEDYLNAKTGDPLMVEGIVVLINSKSAGNSRNNLFVMDATGVGGYYNYQMDADPIKDLGIAVGMTVRISGEAQPYNGLPEFKNASVKIIDETIKEFDYIDITDKFQKDTNFNALVALPVVIKGVTIGDQDLSEKSQYMYFTVNGVKSYVRTYVTDFPAGVLDADDKATIDALHKANYGNTADVYGVMITYSGAPYIIPVSVDCFTNIKVPDRTDAEKLALELDALNSVPDAFVENTVYTLPTAGSSYDTVKFSWASDKDCIVVEGGKLTVTLPAEKTTVTLTLTATIGELSETKTFEITVDAAATDLYIPKPVTAPVAGTAYKFFLTQANLGKVFYITGEVDGRYLATTDKAEQGVDVYVETVEGGVKFYILVEDAKQYITIYSNTENKTSVNFDAAGTTVFTYKSDVNAWSTNFNGVDVYLGTYKTYNTVSVSELSYITTENTGVSQFPAGFATLAPAAYDTKPVTAPAADTAYKFFLTQANLGKAFYITGEVDGRYLATTDKAEQGVDVYVETVEGGVKFYILVEDAKQYITIYSNTENKTSVNFDAAGTTVFTYKSDVNAWSTNFNGVDVYLGTYKTYNTVSVSELSYITTENTGVSQFPAGFGSLELKEVAPKAVTAPAADTAYKFFLTQANLGKVFYITGEVDGRYLATTDKISRAVDVYVETVEGGVKFYILVEDAKQYITIYSNTENKTSVNFDAAGTTVFTYKSDVNAWSTNFNGVDVYLGTYKTYNTVSVSELSYITTENTGVSQFPAGFATIEFVSTEVHTHSYEATVTAPTCIKGGYTTHACECSDKYTDTETAALGHTIAEGVCSTCGAKVATVVEANTTASAQENEKFTTEMYIVTGVIDEIASTKYGNCYIKDAEGNKLYVYGLYDLTNTRYDAMTVKPVVGDTITVTGIVGNYNGAQMKNGVVTDLVAHTHDYTALANKCGVCGGITEHTCADADSNNACDLCGADITSYVFTKATSVAAGNTIVLVNDTDKKQMTTLGAQTYGEIADYTTNPSGAIVLTVELVSEGVYALKTADGKYASWSSGNSLKAASARDDEGKTTSWKISFDEDGNAVIESCVEEGRTIRYNSSSPRFAAYGAASSITGKIQIYTRTETAIEA